MHMMIQDLVVALHPINGHEHAQVQVEPKTNISYNKNCRL